MKRKKMSWRPEVGGFLTRILASIKRLGQDELGTEVVQLVLILPIVIGLLWSSFEIWQLMDLRSAVHSTAAQATRYISAYAAPPDEVDDPVLPEQIVWNIEQLIDNSLGGRRGILGSGLDWEINWYWIVDPERAVWDGNVIEVEDGVAFVQGLECTNYVANEQFGIELLVSVPWRTILFGLGRRSETDYVLNLREVAMGSVPCAPYCNLHAGIQGMSVEEDECTVTIGWSFDCSYIPNEVQVWLGGEGSGVLVCRTFMPIAEPRCNVTVPRGSSTLQVIAFGGAHRMTANVPVVCP